MARALAEHVAKRWSHAAACDLNDAPFSGIHSLFNAP